MILPVYAAWVASQITCLVWPPELSHKLTSQLDKPPCFHTPQAETAAEAVATLVSAGFLPHLAEASKTPLAPHDDSATDSAAEPTASGVYRRPTIADYVVAYRSGGMNLALTGRAGLQVTCTLVPHQQVHSLHTCRQHHTHRLAAAHRVMNLFWRVMTCNQQTGIACMRLGTVASACSSTAAQVASTQQ